MFIVARSLSLAAHSIQESTTQKGWRGSDNADMVQPLSLQMQGARHLRRPGRPQAAPLLGAPLTTVDTLP